MAIPGLNAAGNWETSKLEGLDATSIGKWGMQYRTGALLNTRVKTLADELKNMLSDPKSELDNPIVLAKISALNGHYNGARQAQSNIMKSLKDTSQAIIRNM
ncbi:type III secretion apparatus needle protein [Yersinia canariae]|uniref:Type III secretion apparatus needle protein n=1 Tax=Yersinia canariae TaxID=2607663 RepID=A0A857F2E8_9GAMM|nr:EscF/YscF/HrpA family type III secretion system needle major subunit [Yersinia canariae]QHB33886.1 type III secretion apparatus needle protein [Yersinia canariae]